MNRIVATGFVALSMLCANSRAAQPGAPAPKDTEEQVMDTETMQAAARAREALARELGVSPSDFKVTRVEPAQWSDSSLGCRRPGSMYLQVISEGHSVMLEHAGKSHEVHVSGKIVVVCDSATGSNGRPKMPTRAQGLQEASARARNDLAQRLRLDPKAVRIVRMEPQQWPDSSLGCVGTVKGEAGPVSGYKLHLNASGRIYTYHTDLKNVLACPPIEEN